MDYPSIANKHERMEAAKLNYKRRLLEERAKRIHQPFATSIAVDVEALQKQVQEKESIRRDEEHIEQEYKQLLVETEKKEMVAFQQLQQEELERREELKRFWREEQGREAVVQRDINGRCYDTKEQYQLRFDGEDEMWKERERQQRVETSRDLDNQMQDNRLRMKSAMEREKNEIAIQLQRMNRAEKLMELEELCRKAEDKAVANLNSELAREKQLEENFLKWQEEKEIASHIEHMDNSSFLTEDRRVARSYLGPNKVLCHRWKGMTDSERKQYRDALCLQMEENKSKEMARKKSEEEYAMKAGLIDNDSLKLSQEQELSKRREAENLRMENSHIAEQRRKQSQIQELFDSQNTITDDFFNKFGIYPR